MMPQPPIALDAPTPAHIPAPVYPCAARQCAERVSYPADMLHWWPGTDDLAAGFYCDECIGEDCAPVEILVAGRGISLADWHKQHAAVAVRRAGIYDRPFIYVASPYTPVGDEPDSVRAERSAEAGRVAGMFLRAGVMALAPIPYFEDGAQAYHDDKITPPQGWYAFDIGVLLRCDALVVLCIDGWERSAGVDIEQRWAFALQMPVRLIQPGALYTMEHAERTRTLLRLESEITADLGAHWPAPG